MGDSDKPGADSGQGHCNGQSHYNGQTRRRAAPSADRARTVLFEMHYRSLLQLAALLTGDASLAEGVVADALAAIPPSATSGPDDDGLRYLQRLVLIQCRRTTRYRRSVRRGQRAASDFARLPVVMALRGLSRSAREAVVLIHYLDLPAAQAAAVAGVSEALLTAHLAAAMLALDDHLTELCPDS